MYNKPTTTVKKTSKIITSLGIWEQNKAAANHRISHPVGTVDHAIHDGSAQIGAVHSFAKDSSGLIKLF